MFREAGKGKRARWGTAVRRGREDFKGFCLEEIAAVAGNPDLGGFPGQNAGDEADFPVQPPDAAAAVGEFSDR